MKKGDKVYCIENILKSGMPSHVIPNMNSSGVKKGSDICDGKMCNNFKSSCPFLAYYSLIKGREYIISSILSNEIKIKHIDETFLLEKSDYKIDTQPKTF